ncbi:hypothetical protein Rhopal_000085-T1 [Rhodotorula paludigena]|uniref:Proteophosphoglycan 5 n=1 Tax=Rhodotorula paludigena TaxID=86838 RepID=A0AAV5G4D1_9BASI|nr:hypothetical protein Rhopal_000085-T1 [Rhodotorula paludigena]
MVALPLAAHIRVIDLLNSALDELDMPASELAMSPPPPPSPPSPVTEVGGSLPTTIAFGSHEPIPFPGAKPAITSTRGVNPRFNTSLGVVDDNAAFDASISAPSAPADFAPRGGIARLPSEMLLIIFSSIFQSLAKDGTTPELFAASSNADVRTDNGYGGVRLDSIPRSSPEIAQAYVLKLRLVCKSWDSPAATVGLRSIRIRTGLALYHLVKQLASPSHNALPCTCIESLDVHVLAEPDTRATGTLYDHGDFADFLEAPIFTALTNASSLESLSLLIAVDFEELESIMRVSYRRGNPTTLQPAQLCWLFEPAVASGKLEEVRLRMSGDYAQGGQAEGPPSTSGLFADLLARCGTRLKKLEITDQAAMMASASFPEASHGDLDFALSYLHSLTRLALDWSFIGPAFLATVSTISTLESLDLLGTPVHTDSALFTASLELAFPSLGRLVLRGDLTGASNRFSRRTVPAAIVGNNWTGSTIRAIKRIAETRGLECIVENHRRVGW